MKNILVINSSAKTINSHSRKLTEVFIEQLKKKESGAVIRFRELGSADVPHINEKWIAAATKPKAARDEAEAGILKTSDAYIAELREADIIILGAPMYNWSIPSTLKAYIDHIMRVNETFQVDPGNSRHPYTGLLEHKTLFLLLARGGRGYEEGENNAHMNFQSTYLKTVFNVMGIHNIHMVALDGASSHSEQFSSSINMAHQSIIDLLEGELV